MSGSTETDERRFRQAFQRAWSQLSYLVRRQRLILAGFAVALGAALYLLRPYRLMQRGEVWGAAEPVIGLVTLFVGLLIWLGENREDWEGSLPKRLDVRFYFANELVIEGINVSLIAESDIRALGQQVGSQISTCDKLRFQPNVQVKGGHVARRHGRWIMLYETKYELTSLDGIPWASGNQPLHDEYPMGGTDQR